MELHSTYSAVCDFFLQPSVWGAVQPFCNRLEFVSEFCSDRIFLMLRARDDPPPETPQHHAKGLLRSVPLPLFSPSTECPPVLHSGYFGEV